MMLVNSIKFIARLNEFQMNDDGNSDWCEARKNVWIERNITSILQLLPSQFNLWPPFDLWNWLICYKSHTQQLYSLLSSSSYQPQLMRKLFTWNVHISNWKNDENWLKLMELIEENEHWLKVKWTFFYLIGASCFQSFGLIDLFFEIKIKIKIINLMAGIICGVLRSLWQG